MPLFYVYQHVRLDTNQPFYIGKGQKVRAFSERGRSKEWYKVVLQVPYKVELLKEFTSEDEALVYEQKLILEQKALGNCTANITNGGRGMSGFHHSEENKKAISKRFKGKSLSAECKAKMSAVRKGRKMSDEHKRKIAEGKKKSFTAMREKGIVIKRPPRSAEHRRKISEYQTKRWALYRANKES